MTTLGTLRSAIATDIGHAERILFDRRTADGEWSEDTDPVLCDLVDNLCDTLRSAREALEAQPPPADAGLLAAENRELCERLEEAEQENRDRADCEQSLSRMLLEADDRAEKAERERDAACGRAGAAVEAERAALDACDRYRRDRDAALARAEKAELELLCIRGWVEDDWAINCTERPTARAVVAMYAKLNSDARQAERALSEARAEIARLQAARDGERDAGRLEEREAVAVWLDAVMHRPRPEAMAAQVRAGRHLWLTAHLTPEDPDHA